MVVTIPRFVVFYAERKYFSGIFASDKPTDRALLNNRALAVIGSNSIPREGISRQSASYPARRCLAAIFGTRVEGDGRITIQSVRDSSIVARVAQHECPAE